MRQRLLFLVPCLSALASCAEVEERPRTEDDARQLAPLPACFLQLTNTSRDPAAATVSLREEQMWPLVFPGFDPKEGKLGPGDRACNGRFPLRDPALNGGQATKAEEGSIVLGGGGDRLKAAWLKTTTYADGSAGGALALIRTVKGTAEVYAVGAYRGSSRSTFTIERLGPEVVVIALDDGCRGRKAGHACATTAHVFRPRLGLLDRATTIWQERVVYGTDSEPGVRGKIEYRLTSSVQYVDKGIRVLEQVAVRDEAAHELRKAELERSFTFDVSGPTMMVDEDSLWSRVAPGQSNAKTPPAEKPTAP